MIWATILLAIAFLVIKGFEWTAEYNHGIFLTHDQLLAESALPFGQKVILWNVLYHDGTSRFSYYYWYWSYDLVD
ncbi:MAG: hypothetical protein Q9M36_14000 [Sulfurovum sp.]|nr:hypothetical protein [Sulfurovum sp.]